MTWVILILNCITFHTICHHLSISCNITSLSKLGTGTCLTEGSRNKNSLKYIFRVFYWLSSHRGMESVWKKDNVKMLWTRLLNVWKRKEDFCGNTYKHTQLTYDSLLRVCPYKHTHLQACLVLHSPVQVQGQELAECFWLVSCQASWYLQGDTQQPIRINFALLLFPVIILLSN